VLDVRCPGTSRVISALGLLVWATCATAETAVTAGPVQTHASASAMPASAGPRLLSIAQDLSAGVETLRIELSEPMTATPPGFALQAPPRIAIDLPGATSALPGDTLEFQRGWLRQVRITPAAGRARLVLSLRQPVGWQTRLEGSVLEIRLGSASATAAAPPAVVAPGPAASAAGRVAAAPSGPAVAATPAYTAAVGTDVGGGGGGAAPPPRGGCQILTSLNPLEEGELNQ
jgi:type IV pilus assembly protein PilQ